MSVFMNGGGLLLHKSTFKEKILKTPKHSRHITSKTQPTLKIHMRRQGSENSFKMIAEVIAENPIDSIKSHWFLISPQNERQIINTQKTEKIGLNHIEITSDSIEIESAHGNFKIVLLVNGRTSKTPFNKSTIFNTSFQEELEEEKRKLILRANSYER